MPNRSKSGPLGPDNLPQTPEALAQVACGLSAPFPKPPERLLALAQLVFMQFHHSEATVLALDAARRLVSDASFCVTKQTMGLAKPGLILLIKACEFYSHYTEMPLEMRQIFTSKDLRLSVTNFTKLVRRPEDRHPEEVHQLAQQLSDHLIRIGANPTSFKTPDNYVPRTTLTKAVLALP